MAGVPFAPTLLTSVDRETITYLLDAAVHAPTAVHEEPWSFVIIQDTQLLKTLVGSRKKSWLPPR